MTKNHNLDVGALYSAFDINIPSENADTSNEKEDAPKRPSRLTLMGKLIGL